MGRERRSCPRLKYVVDVLDPTVIERGKPVDRPGVLTLSRNTKLVDFNGLTVFALDRHEVIGQLGVSKERPAKKHPLFTEVGRAFLQPGLVKVARPRCGIGTRLYEELAKFATRTQLPVVSSGERTDYSEAFWAKQGRKGRARCVASRPGMSSAKGRYDWETGRFDWTGEPWPCARWVLNQGEVDLSGARRKPKAKRRG